MSNAVAALLGDWACSVHPSREGAGRLALVAAKTLSGDIDDLRVARALRLEADRRAPMSERLARVHSLCKQLSAIRGAASDR